MPDFGAIGDAIAARYAPGTVPAAPAGASDIRSSSANIPNQLPARPCVLVFPDLGELDAGNGSRHGDLRWLVRLYYDEVGGGDLERDSDELRDWLTLLVDRHLAAFQLGLSATVAVTRTIGYRVGILTFAGTRYTGLELRVETITTEPWAASA